MHNIKSFNNFTFNLIKLQNYVNKNYTPVRKDDICLSELLAHIQIKIGCH